MMAGDKLKTQSKSKPCFASQHVLTLNKIDLLLIVLPMATHYTYIHRGGESSESSENALLIHNLLKAMCRRRGTHC